MSDASKLGLGKLLYGEPKSRDAIHVAVAEVVTKQAMKPGERVRFVAPGNVTDVIRADDHNAVGIIDPFLLGKTYEGARCWLFLFPGSITSLRHDWTHPAFGSAVSIEASKQWIEGFAAELDQTYNRLMAAAELWLDTDDGKWGGEYTYDNSETYKNVDSSRWPLFWQHYEAVTGKAPREPRCFFTCSC